MPALETMKWPRLLLPFAALLTACSEPTGPRRSTLPLRPALDISDGARGGNPRFYFLPPMVKRPASFNGAFDATLAPEVAICVWSGSVCIGADVARFVFGTGTSNVRVVPAEEHYAVNWQTANLDPALGYRIRVLVGEVELGHADVAVGATGSALRDVDTDEAIPLVDGRTLPIKFRIEAGALPAAGWRSIATGPRHTCAISMAGRAYCWGDGSSGQLGTGAAIDQQTTPTPVSTSLTFEEIVTGEAFTCALTDGGAAYCWGENTYGQLGDLTTLPRLTPTAVAGGHAFASIGTGDYHTCGVTTSGAAYCWGYDVAGELGTVGNAVRTFDSVLEPDLVAGGITFAQISAAGSAFDGTAGTCAVATSGQAYCWGQNNEGRLGTGSSSALTVPTPVQQPAGVPFASIDAGMLVTCARATDGGAWCWGINEVGTAGAGEYHTTLLAPQPVVPPSGSSTPLAFSRLSMGEMHACGVASTGQGWCWGFNTDGQAGPATLGSYGPNRPSAVASPLVLTEIGAGDRHSCAITAAGGAVCWGDNSSGQLGNGTTTASVTPVAVPAPSAGP